MIILCFLITSDNYFVSCHSWMKKNSETVKGRSVATTILQKLKLVKIIFGNTHHRQKLLVLTSNCLGTNMINPNRLKMLPR
jgi:hydroxymethylglutaryl-CoA reductase